MYIIMQINGKNDSIPGSRAFYYPKEKLKTARSLRRIMRL